MYVFCVTSHLAALYSHCQYLSFLLDWKYIFLPISTISKSSSVARNTWLTAPTTASQLRNLLFLQQTHEFTAANWLGILISIHPHPIFGDFLVKNCAFYKNCADCYDIDAKIVLCIVSKSTIYQISSLIPTSICKTIAVRMEVLFKNTFRKKSGLLMSRLISTDVSTAITDSGPVNLSGIIAGTLAGSSVNVGSHIP